MDLLTNKKKIEKMLIDYPATRDNDNDLIANIWATEVEDNTQPMIAFLRDFKYGKYSSPESIRRCRQKLQEENPELRGEKYYLRHKEQEVVKGQLKMGFK